MLDFMRDHPALAFNRFTAPDGAKHKMALLQEMSTILNSFPTGATKTSDKWLKVNVKKLEQFYIYLEGICSNVSLNIL